MDPATIIGIVLGSAVVGAAIYLGGDFLTFVNVPSVLIVVGGAIAATVLRFQISTVGHSLIPGSKIAFTNKTSNPREMIDEIARLAEIIRKNGPLGIEGVPIEDEFLSKGVQYIADGYEGEFISESLERERDLRLERLGEGKRFFKAMGDSAPAFGMIGTLVRSRADTFDHGRSFHHRPFEGGRAAHDPVWRDHRQHDLPSDRGQARLQVQGL